MGAVQPLAAKPADPLRRAACSARCLRRRISPSDTPLCRLPPFRLEPPPPGFDGARKSLAPALGALSITRMKPPGSERSSPSWSSHCNTDFMEFLEPSTDPTVGSRSVVIACPSLSASLSQTRAPSLHRRYPASAVIQGPSATLPARPAPHGVPVGACHATDRASRVATVPLFHACRRQYPGGVGRCARRSLPGRCQPSPLFGGSAPALPVSRPARRSLALRPTWSLSRPGRPVAPECFSRSRYLLQPLRLLPAGATVAGRGSHPLGDGTFPRRTNKAG